MLTDGQTNERDVADSHFSQFCERASKRAPYVETICLSPPVRPSVPVVIQATSLYVKFL